MVRSNRLECLLIKTISTATLETRQLYIPFDRCEASNQANVKDPSISRVQLRVFFPPQSLEIEVERPEKTGYDRTTDYAWITSSSSLSVRTKLLGRGDDSVRIVLAGELVRLRCKAGERDANLLKVFDLKEDLIRQRFSDVLIRCKL